MYLYIHFFAESVSSLVFSGSGISTGMSQQEKTSVYLERVDCHLLAGETNEAAQVMEEARSELRVSGGRSIDHWRRENIYQLEEVWWDNSL